MSKIKYEILKKNIDEWDPVELLSSYAPDDEYDGESKKIYDMVEQHEMITVDDLARIIYEVFVQSFGSDVFLKTKIDCANVSEKILKNSI